MDMDRVLVFLGILATLAGLVTWLLAIQTSIHQWEMVMERWILHHTSESLDRDIDQCWRYERMHHQDYRRCEIMEEARGPVR